MFNASCKLPFFLWSYSGIWINFCSEANSALQMFCLARVASNALSLHSSLEKLQLIYIIQQSFFLFSSGRSSYSDAVLLDTTVLLSQIFTQSIDAIDVTSVTLSCLNSINAIDVTRCKLMLIECRMFQCSNVPMFQCSNVPMFQCVFLFIGSKEFLVHWSIGLLVHWTIGPLVHWSTGPLVHWSIGSLVHWSIGPLVHWSIGPLVHWSIGPFVHWSNGWISNVNCQ